MKQKDFFFESEGNAWFERNAKLLASRELPDLDPGLMEIHHSNSGFTNLTEWTAISLVRKSLECNE